MKNCRNPREPEREGAYTFMNGEIVYMEDFIMESKLGRKLKANEKVLHKNGDVFDNRDSNLELCEITAIE